MKQLKDFSTLAEAKAYTYERMVSPDMVLALLTLHESTLTLDSASYTNAKAKGFLMALQGSVTEFNVMNSHPVGQAQQSILASLVTDQAVTQGFADALIDYANKKPYAAATQEEFDATRPEEFALPDSTEQKVYTLSFTTNPVGTAQVQIMQRYGQDVNDLTEWHPVANFHNVKYKQDTHKVQIGACNHAVRQLKVVSNQAIGMSVV